MYNTDPSARSLEAVLNNQQLYVMEHVTLHIAALGSGPREFIDATQLIKINDISALSLACKDVITEWCCQQSKDTPPYIEKVYITQAK